MKTCKRCGASKPLEEFYAQPGNNDGRAGKCKECAKELALSNRNDNIERARAYDRERGKTASRIASTIEQNRIWRSADRRRTKAHNAVARAMKAGTIEKKPCCRCGSDKSMAHHESYDRPLDVTWYCQVDHKQRHKEMAIAGIEP